MLLGCIADDLTGATDLALTLTRGGMRTVQVIGIPPAGMDLSKFDAVVVALKSRTNPPAEAVAWSLESCKHPASPRRAAAVLQVLLDVRFDGARQYRSGGGSLARARAGSCGGGLTLATPAFPTNKRTVYKGNLFVGDLPLAESPMKDHPLTPMRDSNLVRVLRQQTKLPVGLVAFDTVAQGADAIGKAFAAAETRGDRMLIVDAITDAHLMDIGKAAATMKLVTGGSGAALGLAREFRARRIAEAGRRECAHDGAEREGRDPGGVVLGGDARAGRGGDRGRRAGTESRTARHRQRCASAIRTSCSGP